VVRFQKNQEGEWEHMAATRQATRKSHAPLRRCSSNETKKAKAALQIQTFVGISRKEFGHLAI